MATNKKLTSLTLKQCETHLKTAKVQQELCCTKITGFHLLKREKKAKDVFTENGEQVMVPTGTWRVRYRAPGADGKTKPRVITIDKYSAMTLPEAAKKARKLLEDVDPLLSKQKRKEEVQAEKQRLEAKRFATVGAYLEGPYKEYQASKEDEGYHNLQIIRSSFSDLLDREMESISKTDIQSWQRSMRKAERAYSTMQRYFGAFKAMFNHAEKAEFITTNPLLGVSIDPPTVAEKESMESADLLIKRRMLTDEELAGLRLGLELFAEESRCKRRNSRAHGKTYLPCLDEVVHPHWFIPFCHIAMHTGLRSGDIRTLTWEELSVTFKVLNKTPRKTRHHPKPTKVQQPINPELLAIVTQWHTQLGKPATGYVFPSSRTDNPIEKKAYQAHWKRVRELGKMTDYLEFYSLRHHFCSKLVSLNYPLLAVAKLAGHKNSRMIEEHYGHLAPNQAAEALAALGTSLSAPYTKAEKSKESLHF